MGPHSRFLRFDCVRRTGPRRDRACRRARSRQGRCAPLKRWPEDGPSLTATARDGTDCAQVGTEGWCRSNKRMGRALLSRRQDGEWSRPNRKDYAAAAIKWAPWLDTLLEALREFESLFSRYADIEKELARYDIDIGKLPKFGGDAPEPTFQVWNHLD